MAKAENKPAVATKKTDLPEIPFEMPILDDEFRETLAEEMGENGDISVSFPTLKIPSGGGIAFNLPDGESIAKTIDVVIVDRYKANAYWKSSFDGSNNPPDCFSPDGEIGFGFPGGFCESCPNNQFGSDARDGKGKACKNMIRAFILPEGEVLPWRVDVPPTSLRAFQNYISSVVMKGKHPYGVVTTIGLEQASSSTGIKYSKLTFTLKGKLPANQVPISKGYSGSIKMLTREEGRAVPAAQSALPSPANVDVIEDDEVF